MTVLSAFASNAAMGTAIHAWLATGFSAMTGTLWRRHDLITAAAAFKVALPAAIFGSSCGNASGRAHRQQSARSGRNLARDQVEQGQTTHTPSTRLEDNHVRMRPRVWG